MRHRFVLLLLLPSLAWGQVTERRKADSLTALLRTALSDSLRHRVLGDLVVLETYYPDTYLAETHLAEMNRLALAMNDTAALIRTIGRQANLQTRLDRYDAALRLHHEGLRLATLRRNPESIATSHSNIALNHHQRGEFVLARQHYQQAEQIRAGYDLRTITPSRLLNLVNTLSAIGSLNQAMDHPREALSYYEKLRRVHHQTGHAEALRQAVLGEADARLSLADYPRAERLFRQAIALNTDSYFAPQRIHARLGLSRAYLKQNQPQRALVEIDAALAQIDPARDRRLLADALDRKAQTLAALNRLPDALPVAQQALRVAKDVGAPDVERIASEQLAGFLAQSGRYEAAYRAQNRATQLQDSLLNAGLVAEFARLQTRSQAQVRDIELARLRQQAAERDVQLGRRQNERNLALLGGGTLLLLASVLFSRYRLKTRTMRVIAAQKAELEVRNQEKALLLKEMHHRVKNNLQLVQGLLYEQMHVSREVGEWSALSQSRSRVQAIALIHQSLYQDDTLRQIDMTAFVGQLAQHLLDLVPVSRRPAIRLPTNAVWLDVQQAVPVALFLNEAIINALKHAFPLNESSGERTARQTVQPEPPAIDLNIDPTADGHWRIRVADNGVGMPANVPVSESLSVGLRLMRGLAQQLNGTLQLAPNGEAGVVAALVFPNNQSLL